MRTFTLSLSAAALALTGAAGIAYAQAEGAHDMTRAEVQAKTAQRFAKMDVNSDGVLNQADREARRAQHFDRLDADDNGAISRDEFNTRPDRAERGSRGEGDMRGKRGHRGMRGHHRGGRGMMKMADANNDGAISQAEFTAAALKRFDMADADNNGTVTAAERKAAHDRMRAQWKAAREARQSAAN